MDEEQALPEGSSYLFNAHAQAILEKAPDLETGLELLKEAYSARAWNDPESARETAATYAQDLRYRFDDLKPYSRDEIVGINPIRLSEVEGETPTEKLDNWEAANIAYLEEATEPEYVLTKTKLQDSIKDYASFLRREENKGKESWLEDAFYRASLGLTGGIAKLVGADEYVRELNERTDPSRDDDLSSAIAGGFGSFAGAVGSGLITAPLGGVGAYAYLGATAFGEARETYEESLEATGEPGRAMIAGGLELGNQGVQAYVGGKIFSNVGRSIGKKIFGVNVTTVAQKAAVEGVTEGLGQVGSTLTEGYGEKDAEKLADPFRGSGTAGVVGAVFGSVAGGIDIFAAGRHAEVEPGTNTETGVTEPPVVRQVVGAVPDVEGTERLRSNRAELAIGDVEPLVVADFTTEDGSRYQQTPEGSTTRTKGTNDQQFFALDRTFYVDTETATKLVTLREQGVNIVTDGKTLLVQSGFVKDDLTLSSESTGRLYTTVAAKEDPEAGAHPVEVNRPKSPNGVEIEPRVHVGRKITEITPRTTRLEDPSAGAMALEATRERGTVQRLRLSTDTNERIREGFGGTESGFVRYFKVPQIESKDEAERFIAEVGIQGATQEFLSLPNTSGDTQFITVGFKLYDYYQDATNAAETAGDTANAESLALLANQVGEQAGSMLGNYGYGLQLGRLFSKFDGNSRVVLTRKKIKEEAFSEVAAEEGLSGVEMRVLDRDVAAVDTQVAEIDAEGQQAKAAAEAPIVKDIRDTDELIGEIEKQGDDKLKLFTEQEKGDITELEEEIAQVEAEEKAAVDEATAGIKAIEDKGKATLKAFQKQEEREIKQLEAEQDRLSKKEKLTTRDVQRAEKLQKTIEEKQRQLAAVTEEDFTTAAEKAQVQRLTERKIRPISERAQARITKAKQQVTEKKARLAGVTKDNFVTKKERVQLGKLREKRIRLVQDREAVRAPSSQDYLSPEKKARLSELTAKQKTLKDRQKKVRDRVEEKLKKFTPEEQNRLRKLYSAVKKSTGNTQKKFMQAALKLEHSFLNKEGKSPDLLYSYWITNLLTDPSTQAVNIAGNSFQTAGTVLSYALTDRISGEGAAGSFVEGFITGARNEGFKAFVEEMAGRRTFKPDIQKGGEPGQPSTKLEDQRLDLVTEAPGWMKTLQLNKLGYFIRSLSGQDAAFYRSLREAQANVIAKAEGIRQGLSGQALVNYISNTLHNSTAHFKEALVEAKADAALLKSELGETLNDRQIELRAWEILEEKRPTHIREQSHRFALKGSFTNTPEGVVGETVKAITKWGNQNFGKKFGKNVRPLRYLVPFMNIAGNILNANLEYGIGAVKLLDPDLTTIEKRNAAGKFLIGWGLVGSMFAYAMMQDDSKDPWFDVFADGPPHGSNARKTWLDSGARPYSIKVGGNYFKYSETPVGMVLGVLGTVRDQQKYNKHWNDKSYVSAAASILAGAGETFIDNSFLRSLSDIVEGLKNGREDQIVRALIVNPSKGFIPAVGLLKATSKLVQDPIDTSDSFWAKFISGIPYVQNIGTRPALNAFGEPVERSFEDRLGFISRFYSHRVTDPEWRWLAENGYTLSDEGTTIELAGVKGKAKGTERAATLGAAFEATLNTEERYEYMQRSGPLVRQKVAEYRSKYGTSGYREEIQERLSRDVGKIRSRVRRDMFIK